VPGFDAPAVGFLENILSQQFFRCAGVFLSDPKPHSADSAGIEPIKSHDILIAEKAFDVSGFQNGLGEQGFGQVAESAENYDPFIS